MLGADTKARYKKEIFVAVQTLMDDGYITHVEESDDKYMMYFAGELNQMTDYEIIQNRKDFQEF
tara:strand:+ start:321 stop:512 length:192 start_codon:yes stop_codon:yes gene_type:complete